MDGSASIMYPNASVSNLAANMRRYALPWIPSTYASAWDGSRPDTSATRPIHRLVASNPTGERSGFTTVVPYLSR